MTNNVFTCVGWWTHGNGYSKLFKGATGEVPGVLASYLFQSLLKSAGNLLTGKIDERRAPSRILNTWLITARLLLSLYSCQC